MGECTVVLVGGNNGGKEHLLQELLGRRQGGAWCYSYRHITYDLRLLPLCALQSPALRGADCTVLVTPALDLQRALAALPALWQRSHRLVVYITDRGAARRRGVIIDPAALSAGLGCPVVVGVSTNDGLGASWENMARLYQRKHYYFVPYGQDDPTNKPNSLKADFARLPAALDAALAGRQLQPVLLQNNV